MAHKERGHATIISLAPYRVLDTHHQMGYFVIEAKTKNEPYVKLVVWDGFATRDFGERRIEPQIVEARDLAEDLIGVYRDDNLIKHGVFVAEGDEPTEEELAKARTTMEATMRFEIDEADSSWSRYHDRKRISLHAVKAAEYFALKREWTVDMREMLPCPGCQELISPLAIKCPKCGVIKDWEQARILGMVTPEQYDFATRRNLPIATGHSEDLEEIAPEKRGPGRPRKIVTEA